MLFWNPSHFTDMQSSGFLNTTMHHIWNGVNHIHIWVVFKHDLRRNPGELGLDFLLGFSFHTWTTQLQTSRKQTHISRGNSGKGWSSRRRLDLPSSSCCRDHVIFVYITSTHILLREWLHFFRQPFFVIFFSFVLSRVRVGIKHQAAEDLWSSVPVWKQLMPDTVSHFDWEQVNPVYWPTPVPCRSLCSVLSSGWERWE